VYELDDGRVPPAGLSIKCPKCKAPFTVHRSQVTEPTAHTPGKVPLPGSEKPRPAVQSRAPGSGAVVALPGSGKHAPVAPSAGIAKAAGMHGAVVPLPGVQAQKGAGPSAAVPLPGDEPTEQIENIRDALSLAGPDLAAPVAQTRRSETPSPEIRRNEIPKPSAHGNETLAPWRSETPLPEIRRGEIPKPSARREPPQMQRLAAGTDVRASEIALPGAKRTSTPSQLRPPETAAPKVRGGQIPLPGGRQAETPVPEARWSETPRHEATGAPARPFETPSGDAALRLPGLENHLPPPSASDFDLPLPTPEPIQKPAKAAPRIATPSRTPTPAPFRSATPAPSRQKTPAPSDLLPDLAAELAGPSVPLALDLPPPAAPSRSAPTPRTLKALDEDTALTPKVAVDDTALAPKMGLDELDLGGMDEGGPHPGAIDFELARPTPMPPVSAVHPDLPTPDESVRSGESLEIDEAPRPSRTRVPPVIPPRVPPPLRPATRWAPFKEANSKEKVALVGAMFRAALRKPKFLISTAGAIALSAFLFLGIRAGSSPKGYFWTGTFVKRAHTNAAIGQAIQKAEEKLGRGTFNSAREALGTAAQLLASAPDDDDARAFFILSASELKLAHGQNGADWDLAKRTIDKMKGSELQQERARGAFALANGDARKAGQILAPRDGHDTETSWLYAMSLARAGDAARAAQVLDTALKARGANPKLLVLRGTLAKQKGSPDAAQFFEKALAQNPDDGAAIIELADLKLRAQDVTGATPLLDKALGDDVRKTLDAGEEARASMLRGKLLVARHQSAEAAQSFERALSLDPNSAENHAAYGAYLVQRADWEKAHKQLETAVSLDSTKGAWIGDLARADLGLNHILDADKHIQDAIAKDPQNAHLYYLQGRVAEAFGKPEDSLKFYDQALSKKPGSAEALAAQGMVFFARGDKAKAQEKLDAALATKDRSGAEEEGIGNLALALGDPFKGKDAFSRALQANPEDGQAHTGLGRAYAAIGDLPAAKAELESALRHIDLDPVLHYEYGSLQRRLGDLPAAITSLSRAVQLDPKDGRFRSRLGAVYVEHGEFQKAETELQQAHLADPNSGEALFFLARALAGQSKLSDAIDSMRKAVEIDPDNAEYLYNLGLLYERGQRVQDAVDNFRKSIARDPKGVDAYEHLGQNLVIENRYGDAVGAFTKGAELDPKRARLWSEVADAQQQSGDLAGAIGSFQKSLAQDPSQPGVWSKLGIAYKDQGCNGCKAKAVEALLRAETVDPKDWVAHYELGYLYKDDEKRKDAIAQFQKYLVLRPDAPDAETVRDDIYYLREESRRKP
jgi:tetratricopeptide (TPR) repeat protein